MTFDHLVGLPWAERGRGPEAFDCWGLVRLAFAEKGIELPSLSGAYTSAHDHQALNRLIVEHKSAWMLVEAGGELEMDVVLFRARPWHVGLVIRSGMMLHQPERNFSCVERYTDLNWSRRVDGIYRYTNAHIAL